MSVVSRPSSFTKGFTLIELLVVISIVSLLASIVVAATNTAREKARVTAGIQFSSSMYHAYGDFANEAGTIIAGGYWTFDDGADGSAGTTMDYSGNNNTGTFSNITNASRENDTTYNNRGLSLKVNGAGYVAVGPANGIDLTAATIGAWIKTSVGTNNWETIVSNGEYYFGLQGPSNKLYAYDFSLVGGGARGGNGPALNDNKWHYVTFSFSGGTGQLYIDGKVEGPSFTYNNGPAVNSQTTRIGATVSNQQCFGSSTGPVCAVNAVSSYIDDVVIYPRKLAAEEIQQLFALGAAEHGIALGD